MTGLDPGTAAMLPFLRHDAETQSRPILKLKSSDFFVSLNTPNSAWELVPKRLQKCLEISRATRNKQPVLY
jgi:hypothetical protein